MPTRVLTVLLLAVAVVGAGGDGGPPPPASAPPAAVELDTPVFSLRRVPGYVTRVVADRRLAADLERALDDPVLGGARERTCLAVTGSGGTPVFARRPGLALIPASTLKVLTGAVALARIGPDARLTTEVRASGPPRDGVIGDLWLVGGGDPLLATADFAVDAGYAGQRRLATSMEALADLVVSAGVRRVQGGILGDESRYDSQRLVPSWNPRYIAGFEVSPLSALVVNKNFVVDVRAFGPPPPAHAASVLAGLLRARGVVVGATGEGKAPADTVRITALDSPPLSQVVGEVLQHSDNLGAEMLVKELGFRFGGSGSTAAGLGVVRDYLTGIGVALDGLSAVDGSGLDRSDRLSCDILQRVLGVVGDDSDLSRVLPVAGRDGTLYRRFLNTPASGKVRAKTGSLEGVAALSGWTTAASGGSIRFSLLANELPTAQVGAALQDKVVNALARYPQAPAPEEVGPRPPQARARVSQPLPMFPLGSVLLPTMPLVLHVFEERYRALTRHCLAGDGELGVVLIERGPEVGGGDVRFGVGTRARILEAVASDDGRFGLGLVGLGRIRVERWLPEDPYPQAEVSDLDDGVPGTDAAERRDALEGKLRRVLALKAELGERAAPATVELDADPGVATYQAAALTPVGPADAQRLLETPGADERLDLALSLLDDEAAVLAQRVAGG